MNRDAKRGDGNAVARRWASAGLRLVLLGGLGLLLLWAGMASTQPPEASENLPQKPGSQLIMELQTRRIATSDGPAWVFVLGAVNPGDSTIGLTFPTGQVYDFVVLQEGREVWRWSADRVFHQAISHRSFPPAALELFVEVWDGRDFGGQPVTGPVTVQAELATSPRQVVAEKSLVL